DEFNVLPSEVNTAAYQMISRFQDVEAALVATRAQILATQIATIDQSEALRSLTAVAEAYGAILADSADETERQRRQASLYIRVLDQATVIQQEFGVAIEDTLEGAAGAAELYASLGISQSQLLADVAAIVRRSGQSGQSVYDRLQRFISRISDPSTQAEILRIAAASDTLNLSFRQFKVDPAGALDSLRQQFPALLKESKGLANELAQLFGPREAAFVRQYFNTFELSEEILDKTSDSAGRAEDRLKLLLNTMQGSVDGITSGFQILAQQLQQVGLVSPFALALKSGELLLLTLNKMAAAAARLVGLLNTARVPGLGGLGSFLTTLLSIVVAATALRRVLDGISFIAASSGGLGKLLGTQKNVFGETAKAPTRIGTAGTFGSVAFQASLLKASKATKSFGKTIKNFFVAPVDQVKGSLLRGYAALTRFFAALGIGTAVTETATAAEGGLIAARKA
ncbi:unnamed protein product, partial [marine sediment metagenome]